MNHEQEERLCCEILDDLFEFIKTLDGAKIQKYLSMAKAKFEKKGRGAIMTMFLNADEARKTIQKMKHENRLIFPRRLWFSLGATHHLDYPHVPMYVEAYKPETSFVVVITIDYTTPGQIGNCMRRTAIINCAK